jgi:drug/metabolite transporter (DMT)-like permease
LTAVALALASALFYGGADFCGGLATRRGSAFAVTVWSQALGLVVILLPAMLVVPGVAYRSDIGWGIGCGVAGALAIGLLYRGLAVGVMGVVSPITAVLAGSIPVVFAVATGDRPAPLAVAGIALALAAVVLVSVSPPPAAGAATRLAPTARALPLRFPPGIPEALGAGAAFGFFFIALARTHADAGLYPLLSMRITSIVLLAAVALLLRRPLRVARPVARTVALAGALDMLANVAYVLAAHGGPLSVVAVVSSLYPAGTVALAAIVLHERLVLVQWLGVALALAGVVCIALAR